MANASSHARWAMIAASLTFEESKSIRRESREDLLLRLSDFIRRHSSQPFPGCNQWVEVRKQRAHGAVSVAHVATEVGILRLVNDSPIKCSLWARLFSSSTPTASGNKGAALSAGFVTGGPGCRFHNKRQFIKF